MEGFAQKDLLSFAFELQCLSWQPIRRCPSDVHTAAEDGGQRE